MKKLGRSGSLKSQSRWRDSCFLSFEGVRREVFRVLEGDVEGGVAGLGEKEGVGDGGVESTGSSKLPKILNGADMRRGLGMALPLLLLVSLSLFVLCSTGRGTGTLSLLRFRGVNLKTFNDFLRRGVCGSAVGSVTVVVEGRN